ncbi:MAG: hypothetical protein J7M38_12075 [Armatimonadetes bacterium]|nr:hypothetical protein [Armatimonadota bacterium]
MVKSTEWISRGWELVSANIWPHILLALLVSLASLLTAGILVPPLLCGWIYILLRQIRESEYRPAVGDVGEGFQVFGHALLAGIIVYVAIGVLAGGVAIVSAILSIIPLIGQLIGGLLGLVFGIAVAPFILFIFPLIVDRRMDFWPAIATSVKVAVKDYVGFIGLSALFWLLNMAGGLCCGIGALITTPIVVAATALAYNEIFAPGGPGQAVLDQAAAPPPAGQQPAAPPPPPPTTDAGAAVPPPPEAPPTTEQ